MATLLIGYARCSTDQQDLTAQRDGLASLGVEPGRIYVDHGLTGTNRDRPGLREALAACRQGDTLVVTKLDHLARSLPDARAIADELTTRQVRLSLGGSVYDPNDAVGRLLFNVLAMVAEFSVISTRRAADVPALGLLPDQVCTGEEAGVQVVKEREGGIVRRVVCSMTPATKSSSVTRFLSHLSDSGYSPNTLCAYAYDLRHLVVFLDQRAWCGASSAGDRAGVLGVSASGPEPASGAATGPGRRDRQGRLLSRATVQRILAATSSFFEWAIAAEEYAGPTTRCRRGSTRPWAGVRTGISRSSVRRAASSRCAARCGCGCRSGCRGR